MMKSFSTAPGFADCDFEKSNLFYCTANAIYELYRRFGALPLRTATVKPLQVLDPDTASELGKDAAQKIVMTLSGGKCALRYDQTEPTTAYILQNYDNLSFPLRVCASGMVFRQEEKEDIANGSRQQEFYQTDFDIVDKTEGITVDCDCETIDVLYQALTLAMKGMEGDIQIKFNNRKLIEGLLCVMGLGENQLCEKEFLTLLDRYYKMPYIAFEKALTDLLKKYDKEEYREGLLAILQPNREVEELVRMLKQYRFDSNEVIGAAIYEIMAVREFSKKAKIPCSFDPLIVRGLDIYTGTVFEGYLTGAESYGAIAGGGRYDNLGGDMKESNGLDAIPMLSGVGFSIGLDRIIQYQIDSTSIGECLVDLVIGPQCTAITAECSNELRRTLVAPLRESGKRVTMISTNASEFDEQGCLAMYRPKVYINRDSTGLFVQTEGKKQYYSSAELLIEALLQTI